LKPFIYNENFIRNISIDGLLCYVDGIDSAQEECFDKVASTPEELASKQWIFMLPHSNIDKKFF
jgi:hypothetical protein